MNHDERNPEMQREIGPELEARIVAWVAGEASAFEAAELERLASERPELAIFKRRIAAVQGLVAEAARPDKNPLRLSPERRTSLLQAIGAAGTLEETTQAGAPKVPRLWATRQWQAREHRWMLTAAACVVFGMFLFALSVPSFQRVRCSEKSQSDRMLRNELPAEENAPADGERSAESESKAQSDSVMLAETRREGKLKALAGERWKKGAEGASSGSLAVELPLAMPPSPESQDLDQVPALAAPVMARPVPMQTGVDAPGGVSMAPVVVEAPRDNFGYMASSTLAGSRVNTNLTDLASSVSIATKQLFQDTGATNSQSLLNRTSNTEVGGSTGNFSYGNESRGRVGGKDWASKTGDFGQTAVAADGSMAGGIGHGQALDSIQAGSGGPADSKGRSIGGESGESVVELSAFEVSAPEKKQEYYVEDTLSGTRLDANLPSGVAAPASPVLPGMFKASEGKADLKKEREDDKPAKPAAQPAPPAEPSVETSAAREPVSTFSLHVSDVSFRLAQAALARGEAPDPALIRPEEFYNAFDYGDPAPAASEKIACRIEQAAHPILQQRNLVRIAMRVPATGRGAGQPLCLTVLLDTSGSMEREDRAASVHRAMEVLVSLLGANDRLTLIGFARQPRLLAEQVPGDQARQVLDIVAHTPAEGGTNIEEAIKLAGEIARRHLDPQAQNRIVFVTDGAANLGNADPAQLAAAIETLRQQGIAFDACGVGTDGLDDAMLEALTRKGDGRYYVLDSPESADAGFARQLAGAFRPAAENVKVQVRFNPARVGNYRLIGFEHHRLRTEDFRNDKVDAAELAAEEAAVALYQVEPLPQGEGELGEVYVRFRDAATGTMVERSWTMTYEPQAPAFDQAAPTMRLAGIAALLAEKLQGGAMAEQIRLDELAPAVNALRGSYEHEARVQQLVAMFEQMRRMEAK